MTFFNDDLTFDLAGGEDLEDAADDAAYEYGGTEARIFLVDAHQRMFDNVRSRIDDDDGEEEGESRRSYFVDVLNAVLVSIRRRVFTSNTALYAVVLYGTKETKNSYDFKGVYVLQDLNLVDPARIGELEEIIEEGDRRFDKDLGHSATEVSLADALQTASILFRQSSTKLGEKRIFLFTNEDDPYEDDASAKRKALQRAVDLKELKQEITLIPLRPSAENKASFDPNLFFKELLQLNDEEAEILKKLTTSNWEELEARLKGLEDKRRRLAALDFNLGKVNGESVSLSVGLYSMVREKAGPKFVYRSSRDNNTEVKTVTRRFLGGDDGDGTLLIPSDIKKGIGYGGRNLLFEEDELTKIKDFGGTPGIQLLGFKPISRLRRHHHIGPSSFLYPDEASTEGSTRLFVTLLRRCRERQKMALARIIPRQHSAPILAALIPQDEERGADGLQILPPGFWVKPLPFSDDFRDLSSVIPLQPNAESNDCIEETKDITDKIVKKLTFKFDPRNFENPHLRNLHGVIESMALNRSEPPSIEDSTEPPNDRIDKKIGGLCQDWKELAWPSNYDPMKPPSAKRTAPSAATSSKKQKTSNNQSDGGDGGVEGNEGPSATDVRKAAEGGLLGKMTVPLLKAFCKDNAIACKGTKKADLIGVINEYFGVE